MKPALTEPERSARTKCPLCGSRTLCESRGLINKKVVCAWPKCTFVSPVWPQPDLIHPAEFKRLLRARKT